MTLEGGVVKWHWLAGALILPLCMDGRAAVANDNTDALTGDSGYQTNCASCHGTALTGKFGPPLLGTAFRDKWQSESSDGLLSYIRTTMPPANPGGLPDNLYVAISDFVARANSLPPTSAAGAGAKTGRGTPSRADASWNVSSDALQVPVEPVQGRVDDYYQGILNRRQALLQHLTPVTDGVLQNPAASDWPMWRRALDTSGYSPLARINRANVGNLTLGWSLSLSPGTNGIAPLVHDGVMFLNASGTVMALDATNGDSLWQYTGKPVSSNRVPISQPRSIALYADMLYVPTMDGHVVALNVHTGAVVWDHQIFAPDAGLQLTAAPLVVRDKVFQGVAGCSGPDYRGGCFIVALEARSGKESWRFQTIARPGQPGADSWNGAPVEDRYGGSVWTTGSYDPELNLVYFGTGQTYDVATLLTPQKRRGASADALFTDSTLAFDPDTGKLAWYHQHLPGDVWDLDWAFERQLISVEGPHGPRKAVLTGGKDSIFDVLDAKTGQYLFSGDMGIQTLVSSIDPHTGRKQINPAARFGPGHSGTVCPFNTGGRNWPATSYDPSSGLLYVPMVESCMGLSFPNGQTFASRMGSWRLQERPDSDGKFGRVAALDVRTRRVVWTNRRRAPPASAILATAGGLVFEGSRDRTLRALDGSTGAKLWEAQLSDTPNGFPITYSVDDVQYVAIVLGGGTPQDIIYRSFTPEIPSSGGARSIWVFELAR